MALAIQPAVALAGTCPHFVSGAKGLPKEGEWRTHPAVGDVNGDGNPDVAGLPRKGRGPMVFLGDGKGSWKSASTGLLVPDFSCGVGVAFADVNGDGHLDLGAADHCRGLFVFLGDGKGVWKLGPPVTRDRGRGFEDLAFADLNQDGKMDLVAISAFREGLQAFFGDGEGGWKRADVGLSDSGYGTDITVGDVNGDGRPDIVSTFIADGARGLPRDKSHNVAWLSQPSGRFEPSTPGLPNDGKWFGVALGDVNGDGHLDLALSSDFWPDRPPLMVYLGDGGKIWTLANDGLPAANGKVRFEGIALADLDGDQNLDLVAVTSNDATTRVWMGDGKGGWSACQEAGLPKPREEFRGWGVTVQDVNGDKRPDLVVGVGRNGEGALEVWLNQKR